MVWFHIASDGLKIRWFNDIIYIANYLEDGLTKNGDQLIQKNPKGTLLTQHLQASYYQQFILIEKVYRLLIIKNETFTLWKIILIQDEYKKYQNSVSFIRGNY